jgi:hypothetical protein
MSVSKDPPRFSPGPKTRRGKDIASRNSRTHAFFSKDLLITQGAGKEDPQQYAELLNGLRDYWRPVGAQEDLLVEEIAGWYWRKRRVTRYETGSVLQIADTARDEPVRLAQLLRDQVQGEPGGLALKLTRSSAGIDIVVNILESFIKQVQERQAISRVELIWLGSFLGAPLDNFGNKCLDLLLLIGGWTKPQPGDDNVFDVERCRTMFLELVGARIESLRAEKSKVSAEEEIQLQASVLTCSIPPLADYEKVLRYLTTCERNLFRCMDQLERLQRIREGELVAAPVNINVMADILARTSGADPDKIQPTGIGETTLEGAESQHATSIETDVDAGE